MKHPDGKRIRLYGAVARCLQGKREAAGLTLQALAERTGVTKAMLSKIEDGQACPLHVLVTLADVYDCSLDELVPVLTDVRAA